MYDESEYESEDNFHDDSDEDFDEENVVVAKPKPGAKKAASKKASASILSVSTNAGNVPKTKKAAKGKTIEEIYQKKSQLEHILLRPDTYST